LDTGFLGFPSIINTRRRFEALKVVVYVVWAVISSRVEGCV
jgi:hypothetical protein